MSRMLVAVMSVLIEYCRQIDGSWLVGWLVGKAFAWSDGHVMTFVWMVPNHIRIQSNVCLCGQQTPLFILLVLGRMKPLPRFRYIYHV